MWNQFRRYSDLSALCLVTFNSARAERNYGMAGCGLGSTLVKKNGPQFFAASSNVTALNSSFTAGVGTLLVNSPATTVSVFLVLTSSNPAVAIAAGTSNCTPDSDAHTVKFEQESFMFANYSTLAKEMAQGSGTTLNSLFFLLGCQNSEQETFNKIVQSEHQRVFAAPGAIAALDTLRETLAKNSAMAQNCQNIASSSFERNAK